MSKDKKCPVCGVLHDLPWHPANGNRIRLLHALYDMEPAPRSKTVNCCHCRHSDCVFSSCEEYHEWRKKVNPKEPECNWQTATNRYTFQSTEMGMYIWIPTLKTPFAPYPEFKKQRINVHLSMYDGYSFPRVPLCPKTTHMNKIESYVCSNPMIFVAGETQAKDIWMCSCGYSCPVDNIEMCSVKCLYRDQNGDIQKCKACENVARYPIIKPFRPKILADIPLIKPFRRKTLANILHAGPLDHVPVIHGWMCEEHYILYLDDINKELNVV